MTEVYVRQGWLMDTAASNGIILTEKRRAIQIAIGAFKLDLTIDEAKALRKFLTVLILRVEARAKSSAEPTPAKPSGMPK